MKIELVSNIVKSIEKHLPTILTIGSMIGVGVTSYFTYRATKKIDEIKMEENPSKISYVKAVAPAVAAGVLTCTGIYGINKIHVAKYAALMGMYAYSQNENKTIKDVIEEVSGKEKKEEIVKETNKKIEFYEVDAKRKILDRVTGRRFEASVREITQAVAATNEMIENEGSASLNDFYKELNLSKTHMGDLIEWYRGEKYDHLEIMWESDLTSDLEPVLTIEYEFGDRYI